ncbi:flagellar FliJ protein [Lachnotalea glycerini]|jgi:flagellar protein FliJ|uniref:Flagellar FliJ protein n=1 Tax=Lachnotalea glycerini TaxID=1763509 RepID=A0A255I8I4_9FIRM|nr:flagellar export protein FliJ [Lachnotalea glycerini]PXV93505.1 flagellar FliJ protein [Lachnotalea glycerini]RDY32467.1 flagellar export protein FliJ [Lachnotalea glycerini]
MAKFMYKMQNILEIKYKLENQAKTNYANARAKLNEEQAKLRALLEKQMCYENKMRSLMSSRLDIIEIKVCKSAIEKTKSDIKHQILQTSVAERNLEQARIKLYEVMNDRKIHEKLKENAFEDFMKELNAQESKEIDELVSYTYGKAR